MQFCFDKMRELAEDDKIAYGCEGKDAKQKSWTHKQTMHVRPLLKGWGRKKGWGKEKGKKMSVTDKISRA